MTRKATTKAARQPAAAQPAHQPDLAELIAAVLNHPDTPASIYNSLGDAIGSLRSFGKAIDSAECIRKALELEGGAR